MECNKINQCGKILVMPIFYHVDPSTVRYQKESYAEAFEKHESRFMANSDVEGMEKVQRWRDALTAAANLKGYDICQEIESNCIQQIVDHISPKLCKTSSYLQDVVGININLEKVKSLLQMEINDVRLMGIWGMGGIGKTTLARALYSTVSCQFEAACFLPDIKENKHGMHSLQNNLLSKLLGERVNVYDKEEGKQMMARRLCFKKVLVVLDDIDDIDHLENLGDCRWFGSGSRIIATTRDKHLMGKNDIVYEMTTLVDHEARQLFNQYAFKEEVPDGPFGELTLEVINYAKGLPLALKVWGSLLYNMDITEWRSAIAGIRKNSNSKIVDKLIISYNRLEQTQQRMFLDLACFFRGEKRDGIKQILESCDFEVDIGLRVLIDRSLVFISDKDTIEMHDLIQEMGQHVVNLEKNPGKRTRLWLTEDIKEVMENNTGTDVIEAIWTPYSERMAITKEALNNMRSLRTLKISLTYDNPSCLNGSIEYLSNKLRWLDWYNCPWETLPTNFEPKRLVLLQLCSSSLCYLLTERKDLRYLRTLNLTDSKMLKKTPDFTGMPNLESLYLSFCTNLEEVSPSLRCCRNLILLDLNWCLKLERLPEKIGDLENLEMLIASRTAISQPPSSIVRLNKLRFLSFRKYYDSKVHFVFPQVGEGLRSLEYLDLSYCNLIDGGLPEDIGCLSSLKILKVIRNNFEHLPRSIAQLGALRELDLSRCYNLKELRELPPALDILNAKWDKDSIYNSFAHALFQNLSSKQLDISASNCLCQRVFAIEYNRYKRRPIDAKVPRWFHYRGVDTRVLVDLPKNWYIHDNFLGFAVCYCGTLVKTRVELLPLCDDGEIMWISQKLALSNYSNRYPSKSWVHFFFVPLACLWDTSKANGKTPNDYGHIRLYFSGEMKKYGLHLLYKDEPELESHDKDECELECENNNEPELESEYNDECERGSEDNDEPEHGSLVQMEENNDEPAEHCIGVRRTRFDNRGHNDSASNEACCSLGRGLKSMRARLLRIFSNKSRGQSLQKR